MLQGGRRAFRTSTNCSSLNVALLHVSFHVATLCLGATPWPFVTGTCHGH